MKRWIIAVVALLVLAVVGVGGLYMAGIISLGGENAEAAAEPPPPATLPELSEAAYYELKNVMLPAYRGGTFRHYIAFNFKLEVKDEPSVQQLQDRNAHMRAALQNEFSRRPIEIRDGPTDFDEPALRARLLETLRGVTGEIEVRAVLIDRVLPVKG